MNTVELIIVIALFAICLSGVLSLSVLVDEVYIKNEIAFEMFNQAVIDQSNIEDHVFESFSGLGVFGQVVNRTPCIEDVSFLYATGTYNVLNIHRLFFDTRRDTALGKDCLGYPKVPEILAEKEVKEINNVVLSDIDIVGEKVIISAYPNSTSTPDVFLLNFDDLNIEDQINCAEGVNVIDVVGDYVFAGARQTTGQFQILKVVGSEIDLVATSSLPSVTGSWPEVISIFYEKKKVYIGTHRTAGREFHIFDVSDPYNPSWLGYREVNHNINDIVVRDGIAYLATSGNIRDLIVLDVHDPSNITQLASIDIAGNEDGRRLFLSGDMLYVGRFKSLTPSSKDLYGLRVNKDNPTLFETIFSERIGENVNQIIAIGGELLIGSNGGSVPLFPTSNITAFDVEDNFVVTIGDKITKFEMQ